MMANRLKMSRMTKEWKMKCGELMWNNLETVQNNRSHARINLKCQEMVQKCLEDAQKWKWNDTIQYETMPL